MLLLIFLSFSIILYCILIGFYIKGFRKYPTYVCNNEDTSVSASILIASRNPNLSQFRNLIRELEFQIQNKEGIEILIIDDCSDKEFEIKSEKITLKTLKLQSTFPEISNLKNNKKEAIQYGVKLAQHENIICLDSDVALSKNWWTTISNFISNKKPQFAAGIHRYTISDSFLGQFLHLEQDILTASSIGSLHLKFPTMCNGANMIFTKSSFKEVNGYEGLFNTNGGDDLFLYHRIYHVFPNETHYIKSLDGAVFSEAPASIKELLKQRSRWISKTSNYENKWIILQSSIIFLANLGFAIFLFFPPLWIFCIFKGLIDLYFMKRIQSFYDTTISVSKRFVFVIIYPFYVLSTILFSTFTMKRKSST